MTDLAQAPSYSRFSRERSPLIAGQALPGERPCPIVRPFDGQVVGRVAEASSSQALLAIDRAVAAVERPITPHGRAMILDATAALIKGHAEELAQLLVNEVSKPVKLARAEVECASTTFRLSASMAQSLSGHVVPVDAVAAGSGKVAFTRMLPVGVVVAITPFNLPLNLVAHKIAPVLDAGCPVVLKPAPQAPLSAFALADLMVQAGRPPDYLSVIPGTPEEVGKTLVSDERVAAITFTGSAAAGWQIAGAAPRKRVLLEVGNSTPAVVAADANVERAAALLAPSAFAFAGQSCVSVQRIYVEEPAYDDFLGSVLERVDELRVGDPSHREVTVGPPTIMMRSVEKPRAAYSGPSCVFPESLTPPYGWLSARNVGASLTTTPPNRSRSNARNAAGSDSVKIAAWRPCGVPLQRSNASSRSRAGSTVTTGPKTSSWINAASCATPPSTAGVSPGSDRSQRSIRCCVRSRSGPA